ncbi:MucB/RseB C-terminal domain-containing protein [sulfur-oxidizing endosymbiont of Gigantopelta aegis]|uniref:MucB/RseB C-terminal domain-containing protein n=1 Tax=sulfur-oxidizing endosymbiont of Gigantopelta aegis TaxID=2794934 RepID=UPI0018DC88A4|nr:MucB/RseB C-terminal domain-containing protein [sulfur-oxidizing endosymbiont of Gigantopelta aegis]
MTKSYYWKVFIAAFFLSSTLAYAQEKSAYAQEKSNTDVSIETLLTQFVENGPRQLYDGTFVYFFQDDVQTIKVHRELDDNGDIVEQLLPMDSQKKMTSRVLKNQYCLLDNNWAYQFQALSSSFPFRINNYYSVLSENYDFTLSGDKIVAGIPAIGLSIKSKDAYRYSYHLWFEPKTATLLKYQLLDQNGKAVEQYFFTDIKINSLVAKVERTEPLNTCQTQFQGLDMAFSKHFYAGKIPPGYQVISFRKGIINNNQHLAHQFQLSDGLSAVSIFIEDNEADTKQINGVVQLGPVNVAGRNKGNSQMTVIGAVPVLSTLHFLKAIKIKDNEYPSLSKNDD